MPPAVPALSPCALGLGRSECHYQVSEHVPGLGPCLAVLVQECRCFQRFRHWRTKASSTAGDPEKKPSGAFGLQSSLRSREFVLFNLQCIFHATSHYVIYVHMYVYTPSGLLHILGIKLHEILLYWVIFGHTTLPCIVLYCPYQIFFCSKMSCVYCAMFSATTQASSNQVVRSSSIAGGQVATVRLGRADVAAVFTCGSFAERREALAYILYCRLVDERTSNIMGLPR